MNNIAVLKKPSRLPKDLPDKLRQLAVAVEEGSITEMNITFVQDGEYCFMWPSSLADSLVMAVLAKDMSVERFRK